MVHRDTIFCGFDDRFPIISMQHRVQISLHHAIHLRCSVPRLKRIWGCLQVQLKVRVPASVCKDCYDQVLKEFSKQAKVSHDDHCI